MHKFLVIMKPRKGIVLNYIDFADDVRCRDQSRHQYEEQ